MFPYMHIYIYLINCNIFQQQDWQEIVSMYEKDNVYLGKQSSNDDFFNFRLHKHSDICIYEMIVCMYVFNPS